MTDFKYELQVKNGGQWEPQARAGYGFLVLAASNVFNFDTLEDAGKLFKIVEVED